MPTSFCERCYSKMLEGLRKEHGNDPRFSIDIKAVNFACKIPIYGSDEMGRPTVKIWDCERRVAIIYSQEEWERKKREGEV